MNTNDWTYTTSGRPTDIRGPRDFSFERAFLIPERLFLRYFLVQIPTQILERRFFRYFLIQIPFLISETRFLRYFLIQIPSLIPERRFLRYISCPNCRYFLIQIPSLIPERRFLRGHESANPPFQRISLMVA